MYPAQGHGVQTPWGHRVAPLSSLQYTFGHWLCKFPVGLVLQMHVSPVLNLWVFSCETVPPLCWVVSPCLPWLLLGLFRSWTELFGDLHCLPQLRFLFPFFLILSLPPSDSISLNFCSAHSAFFCLFFTDSTWGSYNFERVFEYDWLSSFSRGLFFQEGCTWHFSFWRYFFF